jgi:uncharacterized membrane protein YkoI
MKRKLLAIVVGTALVATAGAGAYAARQSGANDALAITNAQVSLAQAISVAEQHTGGKAAKAEFEQSKGQWTFDVEVVKGQTVFDVKLDANGTVLSATEDHADASEEEDDEQD